MFGGLPKRGPAPVRIADTYDSLRFPQHNELMEN